MTATKLDKPSAVAHAQSLDHGQMLITGLSQMSRAGRGHRSRAMNFLCHRLYQIDQMRIAARTEQDFVKSHIGPKGGTGIAAGHSVRVMRLDGFKFIQNLRRDGEGDVLRSESLQRLTDEIDLCHFGRIEYPHDGAFVWDPLDQANPLQLGKRFANDMSLHVKSYSQLLLDKSLSRHQPAEHDFLFESGC